MNFTDITPSFPGILEDDWIPFDITVSSEDAYEVWIARCPNSLGYSGYEGSKVYKSTNGGENWINQTGSGLSGENITNIEYHRGSNGGVYLGTRKNVYYKNSYSENFQQSFYHAKNSQGENIARTIKHLANMYEIELVE